MEPEYEREVIIIGQTMSADLTGGCACGAIRYRISGAPAISIACHCTFCQRRTGSAFATLAFFPQDSVELTQGQHQVFLSESDETHRGLRMWFCPTCGTPFGHQAEVRPGMTAISLGTLDRPDAVPIQRHIWLRSKQPWVVVPAEVDAHQMSPLSSLKPDST